ncbi:MAG: hydroxymyristoyl-ACP dehydratase [Bacteroidia bacterium]|nr:hydroxymyristoyl-ACP dehydratase [Bacteroidia bacterium]
MTFPEIIAQLPYGKPFLFVDTLQEISDDHIVGSYTFKKDECFYKGHFTGRPVTPGVILTECMAQIGVVCLGIRLIDGLSAQSKIALVSSEVNFQLPVLPGETVWVHSEKEYFRFGKLKCKVKMLNENDELICRGTISGMLKK